MIQTSWAHRMVIGSVYFVCSWRPIGDEFIYHMRVLLSLEIKNQQYLVRCCPDRRRKNVDFWVGESSRFIVIFVHCLHVLLHIRLAFMSQNTSAISYNFGQLGIFPASAWESFWILSAICFTNGLLLLNACINICVKNIHEHVGMCIIICFHSTLPFKCVVRFWSASERLGMSWWWHKVDKSSHVGPEKLNSKWSYVECGLI